MSESKARWPPKIGDHVQIVATGASGVVMDGNDARRFRVAIYSHESGTVTAPPYRTFTLRELCPETVPPVTVPPVLAPARRRAR